MPPFSCLHAIHRTPIDNAASLLLKRLFAYTFLCSFQSIHLPSGCFLAVKGIVGLSFLKGARLFFRACACALVVVVTVAIFVGFPCLVVFPRVGFALHTFAAFAFRFRGLLLHLPIVVWCMRKTAGALSVCTRVFGWFQAARKWVV